MEKVIHSDGARKFAGARATITPGKGKVTINGQLLSSYATKMLRLRVSEPLLLAGDASKKVNISVVIRGGGVNGQADAARLAIARALVKSDPSLKKVFEEYDRLLLVADVRVKETRKPNDSKARAARQKSYR